MKLGVVNKLTIVNKFVLNTLQGNITHLAVLTLKSNKKLGILKWGQEKSPGKEPRLKIRLFKPPPTSYEHQFYGVIGVVTNYKVRY